MTVRYEDRHRELREMWQSIPDAEYRFDAVSESALAEYDRGTGALVDELVAAVRLHVAVDHGRPGIKCICAVCTALAALDEAASR